MRDRMAMAASVLIRMGAGLLVFVFMARGLGPASYGLVATVIAYATLASLLTDFGFAAKALRDIAADRSRGGEILNASLSVKIYLTVAVMLIGAVALVLVPTPPGTRLAAAMLGVAVLIGAIGDLALTAYRAVGRYMTETRLTIWTSGLHLIVVGWVALSHGDLLLIALAFLVSRTFYATVAILGAQRLFAGFRLKYLPIGHVWTSARSAWGWAADSGLNYLNSQIDGLIVVGFLGLEAAGVYQAGARFIQAALSMVSILANIHIPQLAFEAHRGTAMSRREWKMLVEFTAAGIAFALIFWLGGPLITRLLLGPEFIAVDKLWAGFAVFVVLRYAAAGFGAALSARGKPLFRVVGQMAGLATVLLGFYLFLSTYGMVAAPWIMSAGALVTLTAYGLARMMLIRQSTSGLLGQ